MVNMLRQLLKGGGRLLSCFVFKDLNAEAASLGRETLGSGLFPFLPVGCWADDRTSVSSAQNLGQARVIPSRSRVLGLVLDCERTWSSAYREACAEYSFRAEPTERTLDGADQPKFELWLSNLLFVTLGTLLPSVSLSLGITVCPRS